MSSTQCAVDAAASEEVEWVKRVNANPAAKVLMEHLSALECVVATGGQELVEPPVEQCQTWRRIVMSELQAGRPLLGVKLADGSMPKCVAMTNLSGHHAAYYSESTSLAKVLCMSAQPVTPRFVYGVNAVCEKARQLDASVLICFCLPFQYGLDKLHWELRTVRRVNGEVVDGEMAFSSADMHARPFPRTAATEHWSHELLAELRRKLLSVVSPLCLDSPVAEKPVMDESRMQQMISMLQEERKRMLETNRETEARLRDQHLAEKERLEQKIAAAEASADARVSKVTEAAVNARRAAEAKELEISSRFSGAMREAVSQKEIVKELTARLSGGLLEREQEMKVNRAREDTLQAQVRALSASNAKAVAEHTSALRAAAQTSATETTALRRKAKELEKQLSSATTASKAVSAGSEQLRKTNLVLAGRAERAEKGVRCALALLHLAAARHVAAASAAGARVASAEAAAEQREREAAESAALRLDEQLASIKAGVETAAKAAEEKMRVDDDKIRAAEREAAALRTKADSLAASLSEAQDTVAALKAQNAQLSAAAASPGPAAAPPRARKAAAPAGALVSNGENGGVPGGAPCPHYPPGNGHVRPFGPDPALEACIAQMYSSMEFVLASARSASASSKSAEIANAKLAVLSAHGVAPAAPFWPGYQMYGHQ